eukprot:TRINITY_DN2485_c0_g1_i8.p1 TRINITY_DN2485_c0_g1~~TRINITY_DN2485_c0_g1_i8.p1  ORF type:complete len:189 (+),score=-19.57 TRINITY_DN2485_c0_g1_i8:334-900(+)
MFFIQTQHNLTKVKVKSKADCKIQLYCQLHKLDFCQIVSISQKFYQKQSYNLKIFTYLKKSKKLNCDNIFYCTCYQLIKKPNIIQQKQSQKLTARLNYVVSYANLFCQIFLFLKYFKNNQITYENIQLLKNLQNQTAIKNKENILTHKNISLKLQQNILSYLLSINQKPARKKIKQPQRYKITTSQTP